MEEIRKLEALPIWDGELSQYNQEFQTGMQFHGPFIVTQHQQRNDLGQCIICTHAPHLVCKIHSFKTHFEAKPDKDGYNQKFYDLTQREEANRLTWLEQRAQAFQNEIEAARQGITVRQLIESQNRVYDEEFDEPRIIVKVPGLNAYLELLGCLDRIDFDDIEWVGEHGILQTLDRMALWAQNIWARQDRRPRASEFKNPQPVPEWHEDYDPEARPSMPQKKGLGHTFIDPSRRPDLQHSKAPSFERDKHGMVKQLKAVTAELAAQGIAPENYGAGENFSEDFPTHCDEIQAAMQGDTAMQQKHPHYKEQYEQLKQFFKK